MEVPHLRLFALAPDMLGKAEAKWFGQVTRDSEAGPWRWTFRTAAQEWDCPQLRLESAGFESETEATAELAVVMMGRNNSILPIETA